MRIDATYLRGCKMEFQYQRSLSIWVLINRLFTGSCKETARLEVICPVLQSRRPAVATRSVVRRIGFRAAKASCRAALAVRLESGADIGTF